MASEIGVPTLVGKDLLGAEVLKELDHALARKPGAFQGAGSGDIGLSLLALHIAKRAQGAEILARRQKGRTCIRGTCQRCQGTESHGHDHRLHAGVLGTVTQGVAVLDVPGLVSDHAE